MATTLDMLVVGDVPEALELDGLEPEFELEVYQVDSVDELDRALQDDHYTLAIAAAHLPGGAGGADIVGRLKESLPYRAVIMVADTDHAEEVLDGCERGLDEHLIRCADFEATTALLSWRVRRCLESLTPYTATASSRLHAALRQATYENIKESLVILDPGGHIIYFNHAADDLSRQLLGAELQTGVRLDALYAEHLSEAHREHVRNNVNEALSGKEVIQLEELPSPHDPQFIREFHYAPIHGPCGQIVAASAISRDLHEVRDIEDRLAASESRFWQFFENLPIGVTILDNEGKWTQVNPAFQEMLGRDEAAFVGRTPLDFTHEEDLERTDDTITSLLEGGQRVVKFEKRLMHKDGHPVWCDITGISVRPNRGRRNYVLGILSDITLRKQLEDQLQETEKMRMIGQLAGGVAHDFNNLLTIITSYTHYVLGELGEESPHSMALNKVLKAAHRGSSLTDQLLAFSRRQMSRPKTVDLNSVIEDTSAMTERLLRPQVDIDLTLSEEPVPVWIDRGQLEQVIFNLVINARDAMPDGGTLMLAIRRKTFDEPPPSRFEQIPSGDYGSLEVRDTGVGIEPEIIEHIFEPFFTTKEVGAGTGLGLASAWGIVKQAGGYIDVDSTVGRGTTFTIYLPISAKQANADADDLPTTEAVDSEATVLLVEDDVEVREALRRYLDRRGYRVLEASTGAEALECAHDYNDIIDILLTDLIMPGMSGEELAEAIYKARPNTHIFLMTGYAGDASRMPDERWEILPKPLDLGALARRLEDALD